jgi:hypothetical protein
MQIRKKWLKQLKKLVNKHILEYYLEFFAGESHHVVKITVTQCVYALKPVLILGTRA